MEKIEVPKLPTRFRKWLWQMDRPDKEYRLFYQQSYQKLHSYQNIDYVEYVLLRLEEWEKLEKEKYKELSQLAVKHDNFKSKAMVRMVSKARKELDYEGEPRMIRPSQPSLKSW